MVKYIFALLLMSFVYANIVSADEGAETETGRIDYVSSEYLDIVIDDSVFTFALNMKVFDTRGRTVNRYAFRPGAKVKYQFVREPSGQRQLSNVWILSN
ncbi:hypothetical protein R50072_05750 [Simiduia litorea]|uniref:hypothetical protein n=1 Tax=Simiduia litorea TaxID=1435348 RepID=UPI0036F1F7D9